MDNSHFFFNEGERLENVFSKWGRVHLGKCYYDLTINVVSTLVLTVVIVRLGNVSGI